MISAPKPFSQCSLKLSDLAQIAGASAATASSFKWDAALRCQRALSELSWVHAAGAMYLVCNECAQRERVQLCGSYYSAAAEHGGACYALAASPAPAAAPRSASSSQTLSAARGPPGPFTFTYHDRFLGKAVCIPVVQHLQIAAPLMLITSALHFARGRAAAGAAPQQPAPPVGCMTVQLWPAQCTRFMLGFTLKACDRASTAPASSQVHFSTASPWSACILQRVMAGYVSKVQVRCAAARPRLFY